MRSAPILAAAALLALAPAAQAAGFAELVAGASIPQGDDDWEGQIDTSVKVGLRAGTWFDGFGEKARGGFELGVDWSPLETDFAQQVDSDAWDVSAHRLRALAGLRVGIPIGHSVMPFVRVAAGIDYIMASADLDLGLLGQYHWDEDDLGFAIEPGAGVLLRAASVALGFQFAVPMAFHDDDEQNGPNYEYTAYDLDLLFTLSTAW